MPSTARVCTLRSKKSINAPPRLMLNRNSKYIINKKMGIPVHVPNTQLSTLSDSVRLILPRSCTACCAIRVAKSKRASANKKSNSSWVCASTCWRSCTIVASLWLVCSAIMASLRFIPCVCKRAIACSTLL